MQNNNLQLAITALALSACMNSSAQFDDDEEALFDLYGDEYMISLATGIEQPIAKAPAVATVITDDDIQKMGATDIDEVLETVPGLHVSRNEFGYAPIYSFRGIYATFNPQVLMLINGIPITNLFRGDRNVVWGGMPVKSIARVEVIRGPGSAVFGADAFAGVINIITKSHGDISNSTAGIRYGSFNTKDAWIVGSHSFGETKAALMLELHDTDGQREKIREDAQTTFDNLSATNASFAPGGVNLQRENYDLRFELEHGNYKFRSGVQSRRNVGSGAGIGQALDPTNRYESDRVSADLTYNNPDFKKDWDLTVQASYLETSQEIDEDLRIFPPGADLTLASLGSGWTDGLIGNPEVFETHSRFNVSAFYTGLANHTLRMGWGYYYGDLYRVKESKNFGVDPSNPPSLLSPGGPVVDVTDTPYVFLQEGDRKNQHTFVQDIWKLASDWELTAGVRYDDYSDFGNTTNPRVALVWSTSLDLTSKFLYGKAFRSPSFTETLAINNPVALGSEDLDPETIESYELAFDYHPSEDLRLGLNLFYYDWDDIIQFVADSNAPTSTARNAGEQTGKGFEIEAAWSLNNHLDFKGNYAFQSSEDEASDTHAARAPRQQIYLASCWQINPDWQLHSQLHWVLDRPRENGDTRSEVSDFHTVDLTLRRQFTQNNFSVVFAARNIFDEDAREPSPWSNPAASIPNDLPLAGRSFYAELEYSFK